MKKLILGLMMVFVFASFAHGEEVATEAAQVLKNIRGMV